MSCSDEARHNFESGDYVTFREVEVRLPDCQVWSHWGRRGRSCGSYIAIMWIWTNQSLRTGLVWEGNQKTYVLLALLYLKA